MNSRRPQPPRSDSKSTRSDSNSARPRGGKTAAGQDPAAKVSYTRKPESMSLEDWQTALRRQFGREQDFRLKNVGDDPIFSEFQVTNPQTKSTYRVVIRGSHPGENHCTCPDFTVNTLGTCKHIEWTLSRLEKRKGARAAFREGFQPRYSEVYLRYGARREVVFRAGADCPQRLKRLAADYFDEQGILRPEAFARFEVFIKEMSSGGHTLRCHDDVLEFVAQVRDNAWRGQLIDKSFPDGVESARLKTLLKVPLYSYQARGALFAARAGRSLIADDMGLGKTIQAIAAVEILARTVGVQKVLVISPTSLKHQWKQEIERFTDRPATVVEGSLTVRGQLYRAESFYKITNYDVLRRDGQLIREWEPDVIILDEAQRIKNWKTKTAKSVKRLSSEYCIVLTGTPLENRLEELHSIVEFVDRFRLGPSFRFLNEHQVVDPDGRVIGYRNLTEVSKTLEPILLRRLKKDVLLELPERMEKKFFVPMTEQQLLHHTENQEIVARLTAKWRRYKFLSESDQRRLMIALQNMRMSCNSTYLLDQETDFGVKVDELATLLGDVFEDKDSKVVIFSQWTRTHELIERRLQAKGWGYVFLHGGVPGSQRKDLIRDFKNDPECRVFLSTDAGGVGLNLQNASMVVNMDLPWNPAVLEQRIGRVHRLGQHRPVRVVNFIAQGTIEHGMLSLLSFKKSLFAGVLDGGQDEVFLGQSRMKRFMESVERVSESIPEAMPLQPGEEEMAAERRRDEAEPEPVETGAPAATATADGAAEGATMDSDQEGMAAVVGGSAAAATSSPGGERSQQVWSELLTAGMSFLEKLGQSMNIAGFEKTPGGSGIPRRAGGADSAGGLRDAAESPFVARDEKTGEPYLRVPMPPPETLRKVADLLGGFLR